MNRSSKRDRSSSAKTVLVIEDNPVNMKLVRTVLQIGGHQVIEAMDAETGIQMTNELMPDLILMDIQLPGMDGLEATRVLKKSDDTRHIPVVALTSYAMHGDEKKAQEAGCDGYICKPIDTRTFLGVLEKFLSSAAD